MCFNSFPLCGPWKRGELDFWSVESSQMSQQGGQKWDNRELNYPYQIVFLEPYYCLFSGCNVDGQVTLLVMDHQFHWLLFKLSQKKAAELFGFPVFNFIRLQTNCHWKPLPRATFHLRGKSCSFPDGTGAGSARSESLLVSRQEENVSNGVSIYCLFVHLYRLSPWASSVPRLP